MSDESPEIRTARRRYVTVCALFWLPPGLAMAPLVLLFTERGMALAAIAGFYATHSLTVAALELPTGGLSDVLGRRPVLAVAGGLNAIALLIHALGTTAWALALGMVLMGTARALAAVRRKPGTWTPSRRPPARRRPAHRPRAR
ncbi:hypothetical protein WJ438_30570 [Streptomyces sp. GD-15H]|uniref:hypothetical protein n=1 Tax=Streptomyces sp. GD-15H TaxID=3129112 RepID=UPI003247D499